MTGFRRGIGRGPRRPLAWSAIRPIALAIIAPWALFAGAPAAPSPAVLAAQGPAGCPVDTNACLQARRIAGQLLAGDFAGLLANAAARDSVCDGSDGRIGLGGPFPLCDGGAAGEHRQGYLWGHIGSEGSVYSAAQYVAALRTWLASADLLASDQLGSGMPRLLGLACPAGGNCARTFTIVLSELLPTPNGPRRDVLLLGGVVDAAGQARVGDTAAGLADAAPFPIAGGGRSGGAEALTFYPGTPSVLGLTPSSGAGGTVLAAHGEGFTPGDTVSIEIVGNLENGPLLRATVGQDGRFTAPFAMPTGGVYPAQVTITAFPLSLPDRLPASIALAPTAVFHVTGAAASGALPLVGTGQAPAVHHPVPFALVLALAAALAGWRAVRRASDAEAPQGRPYPMAQATRSRLRPGRGCSRGHRASRRGRTRRGTALRAPASPPAGRGGGQS